MTRSHKFMVGLGCLCGMLAAAGVGFAEETQDSPLYAYTLKTTLERMEGQTTDVTLPEAPLPEGPLSGISPPDPVFLQGPTSQPIGPTVCNQRKTLCPVRTTRCPKIDPTICPGRTTRCPVHLTQCPVADTTCPSRHTRCPGGATNCPLQRTQCPVRDTACPPQVATVCPARRTQCPIRDTGCPTTVATQCPRRTTRCPAQTTHCPRVDTTCPLRHTRCPTQATQCPLDNTRCPQHITKCPGEIPTTCPTKTTECPIRQTMCPSGATNCPLIRTYCPARGTVCPLAACAPGGPICTIQEPTGDPLVDASAEYSFDTSRPAVMVIYCRITLNAPAAALPNIQNMIRVAIDPIESFMGGSSQLTWQTTAGILSPWLGTAVGQPPNVHPLMGKAVYDPVNNWYEVSAVFTGMAGMNSAFGPKIVYAQIVDLTSVLFEDSTPIEVFHDRIGRTWYSLLPPSASPYNNRGSGTELGPNWYFYWKNPLTGIGIGSDVIWGGSHDWQYEHIAGLYGYYALGEDHVNVCIEASAQNSGPEFYTNQYTAAVIDIAGMGIGPQCCAEVIAHEGMHKSIYEVWRPLIWLAESDGENDGDAYDDPDDDGVPNMYETLGYMLDRASNLILSNPDDPDTYDLGTIFGPGSGYQNYGDQEVLCRALEIDISQTPPGLATAGHITVSNTISVIMGADWCNPGTHTVPPYAGALIY